MENRKPVPIFITMILNQRREIFLAKSGWWNDKWTLLGAPIRIGETFEESIQRIVKNGLGFSVKDIEFMMMKESIHPKDAKDKEHMIFLAFICEKDEGKPKLMTGEPLGWFSLHDALKLDLTDFTRIFIEKYFECCLCEWERKVIEG
jgi:ADP-ribose pyrophosphatase YjhB (NUDIX family)